MSDETPGPLTWAEKQLGRLAGLFAFAGAAGIMVLLAVTVIAVLWRYALNSPIFGIEDISIVTLTVVAAAAVSFGAGKNAHISINIISNFFGRRVTRVTDVVMRSLTAGVSLLAAYAMFVTACGFEKACITSNLSLEHRPFYYVLGVAMALYGLHVAVQLMIGLAHWSGQDPNEVEH